MREWSLETGAGVVRVDAVSKRYGRGRWVLQDVNLEVSGGEIVVVTGGNGSGKSTLLRLLVGLSAPTCGIVSGRPAVIGYVPDRFPPNERLSAITYLTHMGRIRGLNTRSAAQRAEQLMDRLALVGERNSPLRTLSKGNVQKVALAQALLVPPQLLVLDEPWSGLDASAHGALAEILAEVAGAGGSVVLTDHRESIIQECASCSYSLIAGRVARRGTEQAIEVVLSWSGAENRSRETNWNAMDGVLGITEQAGTITIRVLRTQSDALLRAALQHGWSVHRVWQSEESAARPRGIAERNAR